jgi:hypothetical protein
MKHRKISDQDFGRIFCNGKKIYDKKGATTVKNFRVKQGQGYLRMYQCRICGYWHLTHTKPYATRKIKNKKYH